MLSKTMRAILQALSYGSIEVESSRRLADLKKLDPMRIFYKKLDAKVYNGDYEVPIRLYFPSEKAMKEGIREGHTFPVVLSRRRMGNRKHRKLRKNLRKNVSGYRPDCGICGIPSGSGTSFSNGFK